MSEGRFYLASVILSLTPASDLFELVVLKLQHASESLRGYADARIVGPLSSTWFNRSGMGPKNLHILSFDLKKIW